MAEPMRPASPQQAPDPSNSYERSHPGREAGMGRMDVPQSPARNAPDAPETAVPNQQDEPRQINAHDAVNQRGGPAPVQPEYSMNDEEPRGEDLAPTDIHDPRMQRHPRREGKGGTP